MRGSRTQEQRDETTVESMYVLLTALALGGGVFLVMASPALVFEWVRGDGRRELIVVAKAAAAVAALARLVSGLWRR
ncbi:DUF6332 family protein [Streptomyces sp. NBC_01304]|uniref:DUF6332 family protein n=1 Tax=Streptomyces sp. NBC_01304 TaxID=2903818 RepID=UPI002E0F17AA|nr:DUF6332 family protein [Streptomyces sp. NBC_01304]